jgi:hypothetical protein
MDRLTPPAGELPPLVEPGLLPGWWEETPAEAARYDRQHFDRDED